MSNKGLIMSIEGKDAVVLTGTGEFRKVPLPKKNQYNIGDEMYLGADSFFGNLSKSKWGLIAAAVFMLMMLPIMWKSQGVGPAQEVAYVNIDINPSIELALDSNNNIIKAKGLNLDGQKVLSKVELINKPAQEAISFITKEAEELGYLAVNKDNLVVISVTAKDQGDYQKLSVSLEERVEKDLNQANLGGRVETIQTTPELKAKAEELNISVGKYAILLAAIDSGLNISPEDIKGKSIAKAIKSAGGDVGMIVGKAHENKNLELLEVKHADKVQKDKIINKEKYSEKNKKGKESLLKEDILEEDNIKNNNEKSKNKTKKVNLNLNKPNKSIVDDNDKLTDEKENQKQEKDKNNNNRDKQTNNNEADDEGKQSEEKKLKIKGPKVKNPKNPIKPESPKGPNKPKSR